MKISTLKKFTAFLACCFFAFIFHPAYAGDCQIEKQGTLPITYIKTLPTVPITINGHTVQMGVDTGNDVTDVTSATAAYLHLTLDSRHTMLVRGVGGTGKIQTHDVSLDSLEIAGARYAHLSAPVLDLADNTNVAGLLGADIFSNYDLEFDFPKRTLTLYRLQDCQSFSPPWQGSYAQIPAMIDRRKMFLAQVELDGHLLNGLFDTGAGNSSLNMASLVNAGLISDFLAHDLRTSGGGATGKFTGSLHQFHWLKLGNEKFTNPQINILSFPEADMIIGEDYMVGRRFWLSYAANTLFVQTSQ